MKLSFPSHPMGVNRQQFLFYLLVATLFGVVIFQS